MPIPKAITRIYFLGCFGVEAVRPEGPRWVWVLGRRQRAPLPPAMDLG